MLVLRNELDPCYLLHWAIAKGNISTPKQKSIRKNPASSFALLLNPKNY
jgi:hypothetical protein